MPLPLTITIFDNAFNRVGFLGAPVRAELHLRHNALPTATIEVPADNPYKDRLKPENGARLTVDYAGVQVMSGPIRSVTSKAGKDATLVLSVEDDWRILSRMLGWPNPYGNLNQQGLDDKSYDRITGPAETVVKHYIWTNATRLGLPVTVAPDQHRGNTITAKMRMDKQDDQLLPLLPSSGIGLTVRQVGARLVVDCYEPAWYPITMTPESGAVVDWEWGVTGPTVTRAVVGGGGQGPNRDFRQYVNTALEAATGDVLEVFVDANDAYSDTKTAYDKWQAALADLAEKQRGVDKAQYELEVAKNYNTWAQGHLDHAQALLALTPTDQKAKDRVAAAQTAANDAKSKLDAAVTAGVAADAALHAADQLRQQTQAAYDAARVAYLADLDARGAKALADGAATSSLKLVLSETDSFRYGESLRVGDLVTTQLIPGSAPITSPLSEAVLLWDKDNGFTATPIVGDRNDDPNRVLARAIASVRRAVRTDRTGR